MYGFDAEVRYHLNEDYFNSDKYMYLATSGYFKKDAASLIKFDKDITEENENIMI